MTRKPIQCARCGRLRRHAARGLCNACYLLVKRLQLHTDYPVTRNTQHTLEFNWCICADPIVERIPWFNTEQCATCGKPFLHNLLEGK